MEREVTIKLRTMTELGDEWDNVEEFLSGPGSDACGKMIEEEIERWLADGVEEDDPRIERWRDHQKEWKRMNICAQRSSPWNRETLLRAQATCRVLLRLLDAEERELRDARDGTRATDLMYDWCVGRLEEIKAPITDTILPLLRASVESIEELTHRPPQEALPTTGPDALAILEEVEMHQTRRVPVDEVLVGLYDLKEEEA